jgi:peptidoglycan glycosyltransferase
MNRQLKQVTRLIISMFLVLFLALTIIQFFAADDLRADARNQRTMKNSFGIERGPIIVGGEAVALSEPIDSDYKFDRVYPQGTLYAAVTGYFSRYQGATGIEAAMNRELSGETSSMFLERINRIISGQPPQGSAVELTLDPQVQLAATQAMEGINGAVVAIDPKTGKVLAMVSSPSYDPNLLSGNNDAQIIANYNELESNPDQPLINRTIGGDLYPPGSTFKLIDAAAALETGNYTPDSTFDNPATFQLPQSSSVMQNASRKTCGPGEEVSMRQALVLSCNIPFAELAIELNRQTLTQMAKDFGFDQSLSIPLFVTPSQFPVIIDDAQLALASIGQLSVRATPLQMAMVSAAIANDGQMMKPQLVEAVVAPNLSTQTGFASEIFATPISPETAATLNSMMQSVVNDPGGTGARAAIPGVLVAAKTGTAENGTNADGSDKPYTLWFTGFAPADDPKVAIAVVIENGGGPKYNYQATSFDLASLIGKQVMEAVLAQ